MCREPRSVRAEAPEAAPWRVHCRLGAHREARGPDVDRASGWLNWLKARPGRVGLARPRAPALFECSVARGDPRYPDSRPSLRRAKRRPLEESAPTRTELASPASPSIARSAGPKRQVGAFVRPVWRNGTEASRLRPRREHQALAPDGRKSDPSHHSPANPAAGVDPSSTRSGDVRLELQPNASNEKRGGTPSQHDNRSIPIC